MKESLQYKIFNKYPFIFRRKDLPPTQTLMCFGLDVGDGWYELIDVLCSEIQSYVDYKKDQGIMIQVEADQVKEKFGGLRFYYDGGDEYIRGLVDFAESTSFRTCERCGNRGTVRKGGWIRVLCGKCHKKTIKPKR